MSGKSNAQQAAGALGGLVSMLGKAVTSRVPKADLDERDSDFIRERLPLMWLLATLWHRSEVRGLENIPTDSGALLVANHSGGNFPVDTFILTMAFNTYFGVERRFYQLAHNLVVSSPTSGGLRKWGTVAASPENAKKALQSGAALLVYPGGDWETHRPSWESNKVDFGGRSGFVRTAVDNGVPIVPVVSIGGQETALYLSRGDRLARLLKLDKIARLKVLPISLALPWGLNIGDFGLHLPLPAKIVIEVLPAIDVVDTYGEDADPDKVAEDVIARMQETLDKLAAERRFPIIG